MCQQLHDVHSHFHQQLRLAVTKQRSLTVGECFLTCKEKFLVHGNYCSNLLNAQELLDKLSQNSPSFSAVLSASYSLINNISCLRRQNIVHSYSL